MMPVRTPNHLYGVFMAFCYSAKALVLDPKYVKAYYRCGRFKSLEPLSPCLGSLQTSHMPSTNVAVPAGCG